MFHKNETCFTILINVVSSQNFIMKKTNYWKYIAIIFIALFVLMISLGLLRLYTHARSKILIPASSEQLAKAHEIVMHHVQTINQDASNYTIIPSQHVRSFRKDNRSRELISLTLSKNNMRHFYLVDVVSEKILVHSQTEFYESLDSEMRKQKKHWLRWQP